MTRRLAFDLLADLNESGVGIDTDSLDMDAVTDLYRAECERQGYEFVDASGGNGEAQFKAASDWADVDSDDVPAQAAAWQSVHDAISVADIRACTR